MRLLIIGPPGAGKGTMAEFVCEHYALVHLSTGDLFRSNIKNQTELGRQAAAYIEQGQLVPDTVTNGMVERVLFDEIKDQPFLLDGYPRKTSQAEALEGYLSRLGVALDGVLELVVDDALIISRLAGRRVCLKCGASYHVDNKRPADGLHCDHCGEAVVQRQDDNEATIRRRLEVYRAETQPLLEYYGAKGLLLPVDNSGSIAEASARAQAVLDRKVNAPA